MRQFWILHREDEPEDMIHAPYGLQSSIQFHARKDPDWVWKGVDDELDEASSRLVIKLKIRDEKVKIIYKFISKDKKFEEEFTKIITDKNKTLCFVLLDWQTNQGSNNPPEKLFEKIKDQLEPTNWVFLTGFPGLVKEKYSENDLKDNLITKPVVQSVLRNRFFNAVFDKLYAP